MMKSKKYQQFPNRKENKRQTDESVEFFPGTRNAAHEGMRVAEEVGTFSLKEVGLGVLEGEG